MEPQILPQELLVEILLKVPVKSLLRFKCVCKSWLSLISDPIFARSHLELDHASNQRLLLFAERGAEIDIRSIDVNASSLRHDSASCSVKLSFPIPDSMFYVQVVGSCRGFVVLELDRNIYIWNPCTGFHKQLPPSPMHDCEVWYEIKGFFVSVSPFLFGFGYDPSTDDYVVAIASQFEGNHGNFKEIRAQFFSWRANAWQELEADGLRNLHVPSDGDSDGDSDEDCGFNVGLNFSGAIHWLAQRPWLPFCPSVDVIVVFDLKERVFSEIKLPSDFRSEHKHGDCKLLVLGGFLCICVHLDIGSEIWVMQEYRVESSWTRSHVVVPPHPNDDLCYSPKCSTKCGDIIGIDDNKMLLKFNDKGDVLDNHQHSFFDDNNVALHTEWVCVVHTESLLSLPCDRISACE